MRQDTMARSCTIKYHAKNTAGLTSTRHACTGRGEWTGKFIVELTEGHYRVTVYALYGEKFEKSTGYYKTEKIARGRFIDVVTRNNRGSFRKNELSNLELMGISLKDSFDIRNTIVPPKIVNHEAYQGGD